MSSTGRVEVLGCRAGCPPGDYGKPRPVLVVQSDELTVADCGSVVVCPMTTTLTGIESFRVAIEVFTENGLRQRSEVMVEKMAGVARPRLREVIGRLDRATFQAVERVAAWFGFTVGAVRI